MKPTQLRVNNIHRDGVSKVLLMVTLIQNEGFASAVVNKADEGLIQPGWFAEEMELSDFILTKIAKAKYTIGKDERPFNDKPSYVFELGGNRLYYSAGQLMKKTSNGFVFVSSVQIKTVSHLQNVLYYLTGEELNMEPWLKTVK